MMSSSLHHLQKVLLLLLSSNRYSSRNLDLDLNVPKFNCFFRGDRINDDDHACALFQNAVQANPQLACLSGMDAGISTTGLHVAAAVQVDVGKLDMISHGLIYYQMLRFCQNTHLAFLGRNTPTPLISDILSQVDATILEALCLKGTTNAHGDDAVFRRFVVMKLQLPHF